MNLVKPPKIIQQLMPRSLVWQFPERTKEIFITFDDGPVPGITPQILEILGQFAAKATFFCVGDNVSKHPQVYEQILNSGHTTGNHTNNHLNGWKTNKLVYLQNIELCNQKVNSKLFRPPYGRINPAHIAAIRKKGYKIVMWSVLTGDYNESLTGHQVFENATKHTKGGSIVVFHDSIKAADRVLYVLPRFLEYYSNKGYTFSALS
ncbi:MAG: polysaccharide deacetylase family protein [Lentimicrobiaceae bacterium]|jgi:peptidoglycan/xylan/chitin deacetylase (PgdA/CDA1 family)|nr:polysaccharide deacetylase family protein [Lentimicrobiaceae bacterium]